MWKTRARHEPALEAGGALGPFRIHAVIGEGGMGLVYLAARQTDGEFVALKVLRRELSGDASYRQRFLHEARAASEVEHRHLVPIIEAGEAEGRQYLAAQYIEGRTLADVIATDGPLAIDVAVRLVAQLGSALDALHERELIHRDVKPSNVLIDGRGSALLTDFGLAKGRAYTLLTRPGQVVGTLDYLAPELILGKQAGPTSDIYALGCVVYECLTGVPPFASAKSFQIGLAHLEQPPPDPQTVRADLPPRVSWAVLRALEKDPAARPQTATAYSRLLGLAAKGSMDDPAARD